VTAKDLLNPATPGKVTEKVNTCRGKQGHTFSPAPVNPVNCAALQHSLHVQLFPFIVHLQACLCCTCMQGLRDNLDVGLQVIAYVHETIFSNLP